MCKLCIYAKIYKHFLHISSHKTLLDLGNIGQFHGEETKAQEAQELY